MSASSDLMTIFSLPKGFAGHSAVIQMNAVRSWQLAGLNVLLMGDDPGVAEAALLLGAAHEPEIRRNEFGTPLVSDVFARAHQLTDSDVLVYSNADIILFEDLVEAIQRVRNLKRPFLIVGRRTNLDVVDPIEFDGPWKRRLHQWSAEQGQLQGPWWIDYFAFSRGLGLAMPPFAIGRPGWDNWMIYHALRTGYAVIDATSVVHAVHQNHDYSHVPQALGDHWRGAESKRNLELAGGKSCLYCLDDANYRLDRNGLRRRISLQPIRRRVERTIAAGGARGRLLQQARLLVGALKGRSQ